MFEKLGRSLALHSQADVHIIGFPSEAPSSERIYFHPIYSKPFYRISIRRLFAPFKVLFMFFRIKPDAVIITTHELLLAGVLYKIIKKSKLYYDVQENYCYNIRYTNAFPYLLRIPVALYVRLKERLFSGVIDYFFLAEKGYVEELKFARPCVTLENKLLKSHACSISDTSRFHLLFTGTLAETTGVLQAIGLASALHRLNNEVRLTIIGHAPDKKFLKKLQRQAVAYPFINLRASLFPVPHTEIIAAIRRAGTGIIIYPPNPSTRSSIPTKLYEYLGMKLPVLIRHNQVSHELVQRCKGGLIISEKPDYQKLIQDIQTLQPPLPHESLYWESEVPKLLKILNP